MNKKVLLTTIILCWAALLTCFLIKIFGGNWFEITIENQNFISACDYVDNHMWLKIIIACAFQIINGVFVFRILLDRTKLKPYDYVLYLVVIVRSILSWYVSWSTYIFDAVTLVIYPIIITKKPIKIILINVGIFLMQLISLLTRNLCAWNFNSNSALVSIIMQIDYYIMIILFYLYYFGYRRKEE